MVNGGKAVAIIWKNTFIFGDIYLNVGHNINLAEFLTIKQITIIFGDDG